MSRVRKLMFALAAGTAALTLMANAAAAIDLTGEEKRKLHDSITALTLKPQQLEWTPEVGGKVPEEVRMYQIPTSLKIIKVLRYRYVVEGTNVVLADPITREVVEVIGEKDVKP